MTIHTHTILKEQGNHLAETAKKVTLEFDVNDVHVDSIEKILSLLDLIPGITKTETASTGE